MDWMADSNPPPSVDSRPRSTAPAKGRKRRGSAVQFRCSPVRAEEREALLAWLNHGLRNTREQRLEAEFPTALFSRNLAHDLDKHILVRSNGRFASHALVHTIPVEAVGQRIELGMIGMVYTDPAFRGRGAARIAIEQAIEQMRERGTALAILWSDLDSFYQRLGFDRAGVENFYLLDSERCRSARATGLDAMDVRRATPTDWQSLERLYAAKPSRHLRAAGDLERLAAAPDCETLVAVRAGVPIAYAAMGRGDDLTGVVHDWAGDPAGLVACLNQFTQSQNEITLLEGPVHEAATRPLRVAGARPHPGSLGLMRILDAERLWTTVSGGEAALATMRLTADTSADNVYTFSTPQREFTLNHQSALTLLFGPSLPRSLRLGLEPVELEVLRRRFPWPIFLWGFDSI